MREYAPPKKHKYLVHASPNTKWARDGETAPYDLSFCSPLHAQCYISPFCSPKCVYTFFGDANCFVAYTVREFKENPTQTA